MACLKVSSSWLTDDWIVRLAPPNHGSAASSDDLMLYAVPKLASFGVTNDLVGGSAPWAGGKGGKKSLKIYLRGKKKGPDCQIKSSMLGHLLARHFGLKQGHPYQICQCWKPAGRGSEEEELSHQYSNVRLIIIRYHRVYMKSLKTRTIQNRHRAVPWP